MSNEEEIKLLEKKLKSLRQDLNKGLELTAEKDGLNVGVRNNNVKYSVRTNRSRFFYPDEWIKFFDNLKPSQKITFDILIQTGARINELINIKVGDIDFERNTIILRVTKVRAKLKEKNPKPRTINVSTQFLRRLKSYLKSKNILERNEEKIGLLSKPASHIALKKTLQKIGIKDWYMFSVHNIRKTHGNWLKALGIEGAEICSRLGHDYDTLIKSYSSPNIFNSNDKQKMRVIFGDLYLK